MSAVAQVLKLDYGKLGATRDSEEFRVNSHRLAQFARALGDEGPAHLAGRRASPVFAHIPVMQSMVEVLRQAADLSPLHGEQDFHYHRPIVPGLRLFSASTLQAVRQSRAGAVMVVRSETRTHDGTLVAEQYATTIAPGAKLERDAGEPAPAKPAGTLEALPIGTRDFPLPADQARRYAEAARDYAAYTLDFEAARAMGFAAPILHGMCTLGIAARAVVDLACGGDSRRLRRLGARFTNPVFLSDGQHLATTLSAVGEAEGRTLVSFESRQVDGSLAIARGFAEVAP